MKSGAIKPKMIRASSWHDEAEATKGRLDITGAWCVAKVYYVKKYTTVNQSLEIDLGKEHVIDGFASQGHSSENLKQWVEAYVVHYSQDGVSWDIISTPENDQVFIGNRDCCTANRHYLNPRIRARFVRFVPLAWSTWPCMRVEIYGCMDGTSYESRMFEKMRDIETQRLSMVHLGPNIKRLFNCGDYNTWGHTNYLKINLDQKKSVWYLDALGKDFPLNEKTLTLSRNQFPSDFGHRHFVCVGRTRDGLDIFRQHLLVVPDGPRSPKWLAPSNNMVTNPSSEIPQIVVIQKFDPAYDGGFPIFSQPAIIKASGNIASLAVFVLGIPYYPTIMHNCLVTSYLNDWRLTHLGTVPRNDLRACARLALSRGYEYMIILSETECMSSWYLPLATSPHRTRDAGQCRLEPKAYFISATFEEYRIAWYRKVDDAYRPWKPLFSYSVKPKNKLTSHIFSVNIDDDPARFWKYSPSLPYRFGGFGKFRTYDKALFGDTYTGSHVMDLMDLTMDDMGAYKFEVEVPSRGVKNEAVIELRHEKEPRIDFPDTYSACEDVPGPITVKALDDDIVDPEQYQIQDWYDSFYIGHELHQWSHEGVIDYKMSGKWKETFTWTHPYPYEGHYFAVHVKNRYGITSAMAEINIAPKNETPSPEWITASPFQAIEGVSQLLEVKLKTERNVESVTWFHDGKPIEVANDRYGFPESTGGIRTKLKLIKIDEKTPGKYKVLIKSKFCQFEKAIDVKVIVIPRVTYLPREDYVIAKAKAKHVIFNATIKGGNPRPKLQDITWRKGNTRLIPTHSGRIVVFTTLDDNNNWFTVLKLKNVRVGDTGQYTFEVQSGPTSTKQSWRLSVRSPTTNATMVTSGPGFPQPSNSPPPPDAGDHESAAATHLFNTSLTIMGVLSVLYVVLYSTPR